MNLEKTLTPNGVTNRLFCVIALLAVAGLIAVYLKTVLGFKTAFGFVQLFDLDVEFNIPSLYSSTVIFLNALVLFSISKITKSEGKPGGHYWKSMGFVFVYLSLDELASIHEHLDDLVAHFSKQNLIHEGGPLWILPFAVLLAIFGLYFFRFYLRLPKETKLQFFVAGAIFVAGAVGVEILGNPSPDHPMAGFIRGLYSTLEETMEMVGMACFLRSLLSYIVHHTQAESLTFRLERNKRNAS